MKTKQCVTWGALLVVLLGCSTCACWRFSESPQEVRIDTKVRFIDSPRDETIQNDSLSDEVPFRQPTETTGFYNQPPGFGRYPVHVEDHRKQRASGEGPLHLGHNKQGAPLEYCKCVSTPNCETPKQGIGLCGSKFLCCYHVPKKQRIDGIEIFNEVDDERLIRYPGKSYVNGPFPPPPVSDSNGVFGPGYGHDQILLGPEKNRSPSILQVKQRGPNAVQVPSTSKQLELLTGPEGPTGNIGPIKPRDSNLLRPKLDLKHSETAQRGVLIGPSGPTGIIGPSYNRYPGAPTRIIGSRRQGVLIGPNGPTGVTGPYYNRQRPGVLVGPGGPTGIIGPGRQLLTGPGGPTGIIGPLLNYGK